MIFQSVQKRIILLLKNEKGMVDIPQMLIVLGIMFAIAALVYFTIGNPFEYVNRVTATTEVNDIASAIKTYQALTNFKYGSTKFPASTAGVNTALFGTFTDIYKVVHDQPLLAKPGWTTFGTDVIDPWTNPYRITTTAPYKVISDGPDGTAGTADDIEAPIQ